MMIANLGIVVQVPGVEGFLDLHSRSGIGARSHHEVVALAENLLAIISRHSEECVVGIDDGITGKGRIRENDRHPSLVNGVDERPSGLVDSGDPMVSHAQACDFVCPPDHCSYGRVHLRDHLYDRVE